ncbi:hypothetical protein RUR49_11755 [Pseudoxanthobacter sp. M-2]|uniref:hypothetical protein n=1 Tax=Pseudoxanthobacter sp. M-2 TaxID=3078754 RepID=UPI0038FC211A
MGRSLKAAALAGCMLLVASVAPAAAKCGTADFKGVWVYGSSGGQICLVEGDRAGAIRNSRCYSGDLREDLGPVHGKVRISSGCRVSATVTQRYQGKVYKFRLSGTLDRSGERIRGTGKGEAGTFGFDLTKQW